MNDLPDEVIRYVPDFDLPLDDLPDITEAEPILIFSDLQTAPLNAPPFQLPPSILDICLQAGHDISRSKWLVARTLQAYLDELSPAQRAAYRLAAINQAADAVQVDPASIAEWLHTAEVIPEGIESDPRYSLFGFSHFARAARVGEAALALNVLEIAQERQAAIKPGAPPTCLLINEVVTEMKQRIKGATEDELNQLRAQANQARAHRFTAIVVFMESLQAAVIPIPADPRLEIAPGDHVIVIRQDQKD